jgi:signal-transduction protein with cAMP-binding, CBS, and nucleotidyltransferase domain
MSLLESIAQHTSFVPDDTPLSDVADHLAGSKAGVIGITRDGVAVGTITKDNMASHARAEGRDLSSYKANQVMEHGPVVVEWQSDDSELIDAAILMRRTKARHAIVTRSGIPVGVVSFTALSQYNLGK